MKESTPFFYRSSTGQNPMVICGIDPGKTGGICILRERIVAELLPMPELLSDVADLLRRDVDIVYLEKAQAMPKNGAVSMFNYGTHYGELRGVIAALGIPSTLVPPATWTKAMHAGCSGDNPKKKSLEAVRRLYPDLPLVVGKRATKPHLGLVDALLIAEFGRRQFGRPAA